MRREDFQRITMRDHLDDPRWAVEDRRALLLEVRALRSTVRSLLAHHEVRLPLDCDLCESARELLDGPGVPEWDL